MTDPSNASVLDTPSNRHPRKCSAKSSRTGKPCERWAIRGGTTCATHGGRNPAVKAAAQRRLQAADVQGRIGPLLADLEVEAAGRSTTDILLEQVHRCYAMVAVLGAMVSGLDADDMPKGVETVVYERWVTLAGRTAKLALDAGVEERQVRVAEQMGAQIAGVLQRFAAALGLDPDAPEVRAAARGALEMVEAV